MELQDRLEDLEAPGLGVVAISYDSEEVLADFSQRGGITFPLLSDDDSRVITEFGILNTVAAEGRGPNAEDPEVVADVAKYVSLFGASEMIVGTPYPGTFMLDPDGVVGSRFFEDSYQERNTASNIMLKLGTGGTSVEGTEISSNYVEILTYPSDASVAPGERLSLVLDIVPVPNMHLYAPGAELLNYRVIDLRIDPQPFVRVTPVEFPESEIYYFEPLDEEATRDILENESGAANGANGQAVREVPSILQFGGQTAINLAAPLQNAAQPIIGSSAEAIDLAEDRQRFESFLAGLGIPQPPGTTVLSVEDAVRAADPLGYPVLVRPSYVLGGRAMEIVDHAGVTVAVLARGPYRGYANQWVVMPGLNRRFRIPNRLAP